MKLKLFSIAILIALAATGNAYAQVGAGQTKHFEKNGLEFDYPATWKVTEGGAGESEYAEVAPENKAAQLIVNWQFGATLECEVEANRKRAAQTLADRVATQIHTGTVAVTSWQKTNFGELPVESVQLRGFINNSLVTADACSLLVKNYVVSLIYLRGDNDEHGKSAWETIRTTLKVAPRAPTVKGKPGEGGVLTGRALRFPKPSYPAKAKGTHAGGAVTIQVLIDELGNVVAVCAISGDPLLREAAEEAARRAKFTPTVLSGKPVRVTGMIVYNFVPY